MIKGAWFSLPSLSQTAHTFSQFNMTPHIGVKRWGEGLVWRRCARLHPTARARRGTRTHRVTSPGESTVQDAEGNLSSSRASFSLALYLKQHLPHLNAVALTLLKALHTHWKGLKTPKAGKRCRYRSIGSTGGAQSDDVWQIGTTVGRRQGRVLWRQSDKSNESHVTSEGSWRTKAEVLTKMFLVLFAILSPNARTMATHAPEEPAKTSRRPVYTHCSNTGAFKKKKKIIFFGKSACYKRSIMNKNSSNLLTFQLLHHYQPGSATTASWNAVPKGTQARPKHPSVPV